MKVFLIVVFIISTVIGEKILKPEVATSLGTVQGSIRLTSKNTPFYSFEGVPYAEPPVDNLRFEEPQPKKPWTGIRKTNNTTKCLQYSHFHLDNENNYLVIGQEDCLHLNIYTHTIDPEANLDVLVHIHGGAFMFGSGDTWGPEIIMEREIIYINLNYRLGPLGFLSTEDHVISGNNGLKDQTMALNWIKENIKYFGGNPNSVTIWGLSAGGASVHLHYLMPQSKGLFKQGISQSGCALNPWVLVEHSQEKTKRLAHHVGCPTETSVAIKKCLKEKSAVDIAQAVKLFQPWLYNPFSPFGVVVDSWSDKPVLKSHPYNLLEDGHIYDAPWIISYTSGEGLYPASEIYREDRYLEDLNTRWNEIMPFLLHYNESVNPDLKDQTSNMIREFYMENQLVTRETFTTFVKILSDRLFVVDIEKSARLHNSAVKSNVYSYLFDYKGASSLSVLVSGKTDDIGVSHGDDTIYIAKSRVDTQTTEDDLLMCKLFADFFISFMKTGTPNIPEWEPLPKPPAKDFVQLRILGSKDLVLERKEEIGNRRFWDNLPFKENNLFSLNKKDEL